MQAPKPPHRPIPRRLQSARAAQPEHQPDPTEAPHRPASGAPTDRPGDLFIGLAALVTAAWELAQRAPAPPTHGTGPWAQHPWIGFARRALGRVAPTRGNTPPTATVTQSSPPADWRPGPQALHAMGKVLPALLELDDGRSLQHFLAAYPPADLTGVMSRLLGGQPLAGVTLPPPGSDTVLHQALARNKPEIVSALVAGLCRAHAQNPSDWLAWWRTTDSQHLTPLQWARHNKTAENALNVAIEAHATPAQRVAWLAERQRQNAVSDALATLLHELHAPGPPTHYPLASRVHSLLSTHGSTPDAVAGCLSVVLLTTPARQSGDSHTVGLSRLAPLPLPLSLLQRGKNPVLMHDLLGVVQEFLPPGPQATALVTQVVALHNPRGWDVAEMAAYHGHDTLLPALERWATQHGVGLRQPHIVQRARALGAAHAILTILMAPDDAQREDRALRVLEQAVQHTDTVTDPAIARLIARARVPLPPEGRHAWTLTGLAARLGLQRLVATLRTNADQSNLPHTINASEPPGPNLLTAHLMPYNNGDRGGSGPGF